MKILETVPAQAKEILDKRKEILDCLIYSEQYQSLFKYEGDIENPVIKINGKITFLYIPGETKRESFQGGGIKYSEYLVMFTCGNNNFLMDIEVCKGIEWQEHMHGKMILSLQLVHDFDSIR